MSLQPAGSEQTATIETELSGSEIPEFELALTGIGGGVQVDVSTIVAGTKYHFVIEPMAALTDLGEDGFRVSKRSGARPRRRTVGSGRTFEEAIQILGLELRSL